MPMASHTLSLSSLFRKALCYARAAAKRFGGRAVQYIGGALKQSWDEARILAASVAAQRARVLAEVERVRFEFSAVGLARQRRADAQLEAEFQAHRREMAARTAAYNARWSSGGAVPATRVAA